MLRFSVRRIASSAARAAELRAPVPAAVHATSPALGGGHDHHDHHDEHHEEAKPFATDNEDPIFWKLFAVGQVICWGTLAIGLTYKDGDDAMTWAEREALRRRRAAKQAA
eukprot:tig00000203_g17143.t1